MTLNAGYGIGDVLMGLAALFIVWAVFRPGRRK